MFEEYAFNMFLDLLNKAPSDLRATMEKLKTVEQNPKWHPEGSVYIHSEVVTNRLHKKYNDISLTMAGFFHDIGKLDTFDISPRTGLPNAHGHERKSLDYIDTYADWIKEQGADQPLVLYIVKNHMRAKMLDEMRPNKRKRFMLEPNYYMVEKFATCDTGGADI